MANLTGKIALIFFLSSSAIAASGKVKEEEKSAVDSLSILKNATSGENLLSGPYQFKLYNKTWAKEASNLFFQEENILQIETTLLKDWEESWKNRDCRIDSLEKVSGL